VPRRADSCPGVAAASTTPRTWAVRRSLTLRRRHTLEPDAVRRRRAAPAARPGQQGRRPSAAIAPSCRGASAETRDRDREGVAGERGPSVDEPRARQDRSPLRLRRQPRSLDAGQRPARGDRGPRHRGERRRTEARLRAPPRGLHADRRRCRDPRDRRLRDLRGPAPHRPSDHVERHTIWAAVSLVFLALYLALAVLVRTASRTLRRQATSLAVRTAELGDAYAPTIARSTRPRRRPSCEHTAAPSSHPP
jgi:hypothetical protein